MQSSDTPMAQKMYVDTQPEININTNVQTPNINVDLDEIQKDMDENQFWMNIIDTVVGGLVMSGVFKLGEWGFGLIGDKIHQAKLKPKAVEFKGLNFSEDLQNWNRANLQYEKIQQAIDEQKQLLNQIDQKYGMNLNQARKDDLATLQQNLYQAQYDTSYNFVKAYSYSPEDLARMEAQIKDTQDLIDTIKGGYAYDDFVILPEKYNKELSELASKYNVSKQQIQVSNWSDLHDYLQTRNDISRQGKEDMLKLNQNISKYNNEQLQRRRIEFSDKRLPTLEKQLEQMKKDFEQQVKPQLKSWLDHTNTKNYKELTDYMYNEVLKERQPLSQEIFDYNYMINDQQLKYLDGIKQSKYYRPKNLSLDGYRRMLAGDIDEAYGKIQQLTNKYNIFWKDHVNEYITPGEQVKFIKPTEMQEKALGAWQKGLNDLSPKIEQLQQIYDRARTTGITWEVPSDILDAIPGAGYYKGKQLNESQIGQILEKGVKEEQFYNKKLQEYEPQLNYMNYQKYQFPELKQAIDELYFNPWKRTQNEHIKFGRLYPEGSRTIFVERPQFSPSVYKPKKIEYDTPEMTMNKLKDLGYDKSNKVIEQDIEKVDASQSLSPSKTLNNKLQKLYEETKKKLDTGINTRDAQKIIDQYNSDRQSILRNSKEYLNDAMKFIDKSPDNLPISQLLINDLGSQDQYVTFRNRFQKRLAQYYDKKKNYKTFKSRFPGIESQDQFINRMDEKLTQLTNANISDDSIEEFNSFINSFKLPKDPSATYYDIPNRVPGQTWRDYLKQYNIDYEQPIVMGDQNQEISYNNFRKGFKLEQSDSPEAIIQDYIDDTYKNTNDFLNQDTKTKTNILTKILQDDIIPKSNNPVFDDFKEVWQLNNEEPVFNKVYNTKYINKATKKLRDRWQLEMDKSPLKSVDIAKKLPSNLQKKLIEFGKDKGVKLIDYAVQEIPGVGQFLRTIPDQQRQQYERKILDWMLQFMRNQYGVL